MKITAFELHVYHYNIPVSFFLLRTIRPMDDGDSNGDDDDGGGDILGGGGGGVL